MAWMASTIWKPFSWNNEKLAPNFRRAFSSPSQAATHIFNDRFELLKNTAHLVFGAYETLLSLTGKPPVFPGFV
jgi:hypothetical protein